VSFRKSQGDKITVLGFSVQSEKFRLAE